MATTEYFDILDESGALTGRTAPRGQVHSEGLYHKAVHTWLFVPTTGELLLQKRAACKDSWPDWWDISSAGHLSAGQLSADAAVRELHEELGVLLPRERFQYLFTHLEKLSSIQKGKPFINNEFNDVSARVADEHVACCPVRSSRPPPPAVACEPICRYIWCALHLRNARYCGLIQP